MTDSVIRIENLHKSFGSLEVLGGIDLDVRAGETVTVLGSSGSGKSTLLRCINFMEMPSEGRIYLHGHLIGTDEGGSVRYSESELCRIRTRIGMVFQHFNLFPHMTVLKNVMEGQVTVLGRRAGAAEAKAREQLERVGLSDKADEYPARLSGGQKQRVAIARALAMDPDVMLFDEVTSALDPELVGEVLRTIRQLADDGMTMLVVTHELGFAYHVANRVLFISDGRILEQGEPRQILREPATRRMQEFLDGHAQFRLPF
ncbi:MAG: amino acid ABC transporter ATP-binding protein [Paracoccaceae bacterium]|nr:amino acid ABC transporter ATP-binding protein [Paracoccaceae bacterium]